MSDTYIVQDLYVQKEKAHVRSDVKPLTCDICNKELNGLSITAKRKNGKMVFLCSYHYNLIGSAY